MNPNLAVHHIMTSKVITAKADDPLHVLRNIFENNNFHHIPITDAEGKLLGIVSREDYNKVAWLFSASILKKPDVKLYSEQLLAKDIMTKFPLHLEPDDTIGLAADIFLANKFHALPIIEDERLVGIVTSHDLLAYCFQSPVEDDNTDLAYYQEQ